MPRSRHVALCTVATFWLTACSAQAAADTLRGDVLRHARFRQFAELDTLFARLQADADRNLLAEDALVRAMDAFAIVDADLDTALAQWVATQPSSLPARLARARHHVALAAAARGGDWADRTTTAQIDEMRRQFRLALDDADYVLERQPRSTLAIVMLMQAEVSGGGSEDCVRTWTRYRDRVPASFHVWHRLTLCLRPRWGGSYEAVAAAVEEMASHVGANPRLLALRGMEAYDRASLLPENADDDAIQLYSEAIAHGDLPEYREGRARRYWAQRRYQEAYADIARALELAPEQPDYLAWRAALARDMGRHADAVRDVRQATELDPANENLAWVRWSTSMNAIDNAEQSIRRRAFDEAITSLTLAIALAGEDAETRYWLGRARLTAGDEQGALPDLERAVELDPHISMRSGA